MVATLFVLLTISPPRHLAIPLACCAYAYFCLVVVIDLEHKVVVTSIALVGVVLGLGIGYMLKGFTLTLLGGLIGGGIMLTLYLLGILFVKLISKSRGEPVDEVALGLGDVYISVVLGLMLGWPVIGYNLLLAVMLGGLVSALVIGYHTIRKSFQAFMAIPYVPFLVGVAAILLYIQK
jgi:prepilin signal peptidase PulO-like enzyme (type II secretory pathway)